MMASGGWEPVWQGNGEAQARIVADGLGASGFRARTQGARPTEGLPHAFQLNTWAVFVPVGEADRARDRLRDQGESAAIIDGASNWASESRLTLKFAAYLFLICVLVVLLAFTWGRVS
jgi:hypothetical protein